MYVDQEVCCSGSTIVDRQYLTFSPFSENYTTTLANRYNVHVNISWCFSNNNNISLEDDVVTYVC